MISIITGIALLFIFMTRDTYENHFADYEHMKASGLMEKGWLPDYIPHSATDINERHNIDTNVVNMSFKYNPADTEKAGTGCTLLEKNERGLKFLCPPHDGSTSILVLRKDGMGFYNSYGDGLAMPILNATER